MCGMDRAKERRTLVISIYLWASMSTFDDTHKATTIHNRKKNNKFCFSTFFLFFCTLNYCLYARDSLVQNSLTTFCLFATETLHCDYIYACCRRCLLQCVWSVLAVIYELCKFACVEQHLPYNREKRKIKKEIHEHRERERGRGQQPNMQIRHISYIHRHHICLCACVCIGQTK